MRKYAIYIHNIYNVIYFFGYRLIYRQNDEIVLQLSEASFMHHSLTTPFLTNFQWIKRYTCNVHNLQLHVRYGRTDGRD